MRCKRPNHDQRSGYVLIAVLIVIVVLTLVAYQYNQAMSSQYQLAYRAHAAEQSKANAVSGVHWACGVLADPSSRSMNLSDDPSLFSAQVLSNTLEPQKSGYFSLFNLSDDGSGNSSYPLRYGLIDEGGKINVNAIMEMNPDGNVLHDMLLQLPNMTEDVADAIVDWIDTNSTIRPAGAESEEYTALGYRAKDGPLSSIDELLLVRGVTPELLFGADRNRNGIQDANEQPVETSIFSRGWSEFLTCYGRELNVDSQGNPKIDLNSQDLPTLHADLIAAVGQELADYILYFRISGNSSNAPAMLPANQVYAEAGYLNEVVTASLDSGLATARRRISSVLTIYNTIIPLPVPEGAAQGAPVPVAGCPINGVENLKSSLALLLDRCTTSEEYDMAPRINVTTAPREVLMALTSVQNGITEEDVDQIVANRPAPGTDLTAGWLITSANIDPAKFRNIERYVTGTSGAYRVYSVGYSSAPGGPVARVEAVIEQVIHLDDTGLYSAKPRIVFFRDMSELGRGFTDLPR